MHLKKGDCVYHPQKKNMNDGSWFDALRFFILWFAIGLAIVWFVLLTELHTSALLTALVVVWSVIGVLSIFVILAVRAYKRRPLDVASAKIRRRNVAYLAWDFLFATFTVAFLVTLALLVLQLKSGEEEADTEQWIFLMLPALVALVAFALLDLLSWRTAVFIELPFNQTPIVRAPWHTALHWITIAVLLLAALQLLLIGLELNKPFVKEATLLLLPLFIIWLLLTVLLVRVTFICSCCCWGGKPVSGVDYGKPLLDKRAYFIVLLGWALTLTWLATAIWADAAQPDPFSTGALVTFFAPTLLILIVWLGMSFFFAGRRL